MISTRLLCQYTFSFPRICGVFLMFTTGTLWAAQVPIPSIPLTNASSFILIDAQSNQILAEQNADQHIPPASLTKIMVSYLLARELSQQSVHVDDKVLISRHAWAQRDIFRGSSLMFLEAGKKVTLGELHLGLVVSSGNDASVAIAEHLATSEENFVHLMNQEAQRLGMSETLFVNAHGLPSTGQYTTARDMALLVRAYISHFPDTYRLYREKSYTYNGIRQLNRNRLLWDAKYVDGVKTGYTSSAGYCLVASAKKNGMRLISVVMNSRDERSRVRDSWRLLSYGFRYYQTIRLYSPAQSMTYSKVWKGEKPEVAVGPLDSLFITIPKGRRNDIEEKITLTSYAEAPIEEGVVLGQWHATLDDEEIARMPLHALNSIPTGSLWARLRDGLMLFIHRLFD